MVVFNRFSALEFAGSYEQTPETTHVVSIWSIPNSTDYDRAYVSYLFFDSKKDADDFTAKWDAPPEMPVVMTLAEYTQIQEEKAAAELRRRREDMMDMSVYDVR